MDSSFRWKFVGRIARAAGPDTPARTSDVHPNPRHTTEPLTYNRSPDESQDPLPHRHTTSAEIRTVHGFQLPLEIRRKTSTRSGTPILLPAHPKPRRTPDPPTHNRSPDESQDPLPHRHTSSAEIRTAHGFQLSLEIRRESITCSGTPIRTTEPPTHNRSPDESQGPLPYRHTMPPGKRMGGTDESTSKRSMVPLMASAGVRPAGAYAGGGTLWACRKTLSGSHAFLTCCSRGRFTPQ